MLGLSFLARKVVSKRPAPGKTQLGSFRPYLEVLSRRDTPAPLTTGAAGLAGFTPGLTPGLAAGSGLTGTGQTALGAVTQGQPGLTIVQGAALNVLATQPAELLRQQATGFGGGMAVGATGVQFSGIAGGAAGTFTPGFGLFGGPGGTLGGLNSLGNLTSALPPPNVTSGFSTLVVSPGNIAATPLFGPVNPGTLGTPTVINAGLPTLPALGPFASLPRRPTYVTEAVALSGGGTSSTVEPAPVQARPTAGGVSNPLVPVEVTDASRPGADAPPSDAVLEQAILELTD